MTLASLERARPAPPPGLRVVLDARPLQDPARAPVTAAVLGALLAAYDADPLEGESFALLLRSDLDDPTTALRHLDVIGRRLLPPTSLLRSAAATVDPFLLRGASIGAAWRADRGGAHGAVYHAVGSGPLPIAPGLPVVVTLLDLAPWEIPGAFTVGPAARFGRRLRAQQLREAAAIIVGTEAVARSARRHLRIARERLHVVALAPRPGFDRGGSDGSLRPPGDGLAADAPGNRAAIRGAVPADAAHDLHRLGLAPGGFLVYPGRYDIRQDLATLLRALARLASGGRPTELPADAPWPPRVLFAGATPDDRAALARAAAREGVGDALAYAPPMDPPRLAPIIRASRAALLPVVSDGTGLAAIEAIATGTPVVASAVGALPELIGPAGLLVEPRDVDRLAIALRTVWTDDRVRDRVAAAAMERATWGTRTWWDVADETRRVYAAVGAWPTGGGEAASERDPQATAGPARGG